MFSFMVFAVFDSKVGAFLLPFFSRNRAVVLRSFTTACQDQGSDFNRYAGDYTLFEIGEWEPEKGIYTPHEAKLNLGLASQFLALVEPSADSSREISDIRSAFAVGDK